MILNSFFSEVFNDVFFKTLLTLLMIDIVTGYYKAIKNKKLNSKVGMLGLIRHFVIMFITIALYFLSSIHDVPNIYTGGTALFISTYAISITENLSEMGFPIPSGITRFIYKEEDKHGKNQKYDNQGL